MAESINNIEKPSKVVKEEDQKIPFLKLFSFADKLDVALMITGSLGAMANGLTQPLMTVIFGKLINTFARIDRSNVLKEVSQVSLDFVYLAVAAGVVSFLQVSCWMVTGERQASRIRELYLKTILRQDITFFDTDSKTGEITGRLSGDTILIQNALGEKAGKFVQLVSTFVGGFAIAFIRGWQLSLVLLSCVPAIVIAGGAMSILISKVSGREQVAYAEAGRVVEQTVGSIRTVASFTGERQAIDKYNSKLQAAYNAMVQQGLVTGIGFGLVILIIFGTYALAVFYGAKLIIEKGYNGGQVINIIMSLLAGGMSLGQASPSLNAFASGRAAAYKMFETIKRRPTIDAYDSSGIVLDHLKGEIELKDVYFRYPARPDVQIFSGFSLQVPSGTTAALVGQSGSGKSTIISLLERFYDPDSGEVLIDGVNIKMFQLKWIREKIGLVSQEPSLFATTIRENIAYGKDTATDEEIRTAIELANAAKFIDKLPEGLDTMVGDHGGQLSGGQKQRIAIARAILKNPRIILLDEATSALDAESERIVQDALENVMSNRTTIVVAHRLTTIRNADVIAVVQQGEIVEKGTHEELIKDPDGAYSQLIRLQEGANEGKDNHGPGLEISENEINNKLSMTTSGGQKISIESPASKRSSSSRRSSTIGFNAEDEIDKLEKQQTVSIRRLAYLNKPEMPVLLLGSVAASIYGLVFPVFGYLLATSIKIFYEPPSQLRKDSKFWALVYVGLGCVSLIVLPIQSYLFGIGGSKLVKRIRSMTFEKVVHQDISWFDDHANSSGAVGARLSTDASNVRSLVGDTLGLLVQNMATIIAALVIALTANWILALTVIAVSPIMFLEGYLQMKFSKGFSADAKVMYEEASQVANDAVGSIRTVASFCAEKKVMDLYQKKCERPVNNGIRLGFLSGTGFGFSLFAFYAINAFCFYIGAILLQNGKATFQEIFKVFFALSISATIVSNSSALAPDHKKAKDSTASIFSILDRNPKIDSSSNEGIVLETVVGNIQFEHVSFKYLTRPDIQIFKDLCLNIPSGKKVALVGESGCGKSTIISLLERFYDPDSGQVFLDGVDMKKLRLNWLRQQMGLVGQEPVLFDETIRANLAYGKQGDVTEEEIIAAAKAANAHNFISSLPKGYGTSVGERGTQLSGGQKQRIAIARAILKNPKILLLDEATSALDAESERVVQDALDRVMVDRTSVTVAHRLSTIKNADIIAVVKNGAITEKGSHDTLMNITDGVYASLVALHNSST